MLQRIGQIAPLLRTAAGYAFHFGAAKASALIAVLAIPRLLPVDLYAKVDFGNALAALTAQLVGLGVAQAAARMHLAEDLAKPLSVALISLIWTTAVGLLATATVLVMGLPIQYAFCGLLTALLGLQHTLVSILRARGQLRRAPWADGTASFIVLGASIGAVLLFGGSPAGMLVFLGIAAVVTLLGSLAMLPEAVASLDRRTLIRAAQLGMSVLLTGLAQQLLTATPKVAIGEVISVDSVAVFAVAVHCALPLIVVNQFLVLGTFRRAFREKDSVVDSAFAVWIACLVGAGLLMVLLAKYLAVVVVIGTQVDATRVAAILPAVIPLTVGWILIADLETLVARQGIWLQTLMPTLAVGVIGLAIGWLDYRNGTLTLVRMSALYAAVFMGVVFVQMILIHRNGLPLPRSLACLGVCAAALCAIGLL